MRADQTDVRIALKGSLEDQVGDSTSRIEDEIQHKDREGERLLALTRSGGVEEGDGLAVMEFGEHGVKEWISQVATIIIGEEKHPVQVKRIEGIGDFFERGVNVGHGEAREGSKAPGSPCDRLRKEAVRRAREFLLSACIAGKTTRSQLRQDSRSDSIGIHHRKSAGALPGFHD